MKTLTEEVESIAAVSERVLLEEGSLQPMVFLIGEKERAAMPVLIEMAPSGNKRIAQFFAFGRLCAMAAAPLIGKLEMVLHASEAWGKVMPADEPAPKHSLASDPDRLEVLMVSGFVPETETMVMTVYNMVRNDEGKLVALGPGQTNYDGEAYLLEAFAAGYESARTNAQSA